MNAQDYWSLFLETGAPEMYLIYNLARKMEGQDALNGTSPGFEGYTI